MRILVVEDDDFCRMAMVELLSAEGYDVQESSTATQALKMCLAEPDSYDLVLTDMGLGDFDGFTLAKMITKRFPGQAIFMLTGWTHWLEKTEHLRKAGISRVFAKPIQISELLTAIEELEPTRKVA